ncbi:MAG: hypothetical protein SH856_03310 [Flavobacteriales bacterium]|nr:hypothetical protein [Flavobacteriales bacterium]
MMKKLLPLFLFAMFIGCKPDHDQVPYVPVDIWIDINLPQYQQYLFPVGGWIYITGGSRGIIVYHKSIDEFVAFERHAPFNVDQYCQVVVNDDNVIIEDPCSNSQWVITDGSLVRGPAAKSLLEYDVAYNNPNIHIFN